MPYVNGDQKVSSNIVTGQILLIRRREVWAHRPVGLRLGSAKVGQQLVRSQKELQEPTVFTNPSGSIDLMRELHELSTNH